MKHTVLRNIAAVIASAALLAAITGCDTGTGGGVDNTSDAYTSPADVYGTYWGNLTIAGRDYPMALVIEETSVSLYSDMMSSSYQYVTWVEATGSQISWEARSVEGSSSANVTGTVTVNGDTKTSTVLIPKMASMMKETTLTAGGDYDDRFLTFSDNTLNGGKKYAPYGTYTGSITIRTSPYNIALVVKENSVSLYAENMSNMNAEYVTALSVEESAIKFKNAEKNVTGTFSLDSGNVAPTRGTWTVTLPMGTSEQLSLSNAYNGEYGWIE